MIGEPTGPATYRLGILRRRFSPGPGPLDISWQFCQLDVDAVDLALADNESIARIWLVDGVGLPVFSMPLGYESFGADGDEGTGPRSAVERDKAVSAVRTLVYRALRMARWNRVPHAGIIDGATLGPGPYQLQVTMADGHRYAIEFRALS